MAQSDGVADQAGAGLSSAQAEAAGSPALPPTGGGPAPTTPAVGGGSNALPAPATPGNSSPTESGQPLRDAIVFVPGMMRSWEEHSIRELADDLATALDHHSRRFDFLVKPSAEFPYGRGEQPRTSRVVTIYRTPAGAQNVEPISVIDLYSLEYHTAFTADFEQASLVARARRLLWAIFMGGTRIRNLIFTPNGAKTGHDRVQIAVALGILFLYAVLLILVLFAIVDVVAQYFLSQTQEASNVAVTTVTASPTPTGPVLLPAPTPAPAGATDRPVGWPQNWVDEFQYWIGVAWSWIVYLFGDAWKFLVQRVGRFVTLVGVVLFLFLPPKHKLKEFVTNAATDFLTMDYYLREAQRANLIGGELTALVDDILDAEKPGYRRVHLFSYSFGSIISINALFRHGDPLAPTSALSEIDTLVTIGCPFDMVRLVRPDYFLNRKRPAKKKDGRDVPREWLNVYAPADILGSNFRNDNHIDAPRAEVLKDATDDALPAPTNLPHIPGGAPPEGNVGSMVALNGFEVHTAYWVPGVQNEETCFDKIVSALYGDDPILHDPPPAA